MNTRIVSRAMKGAVLLVAAIATLVAAQLSVNQPVYADSNCGSGHFCVWQHARSEGWELEYASLTRFRCYTLPSANWDQVSSYWNRTGREIIAYTRENCGGTGWSIYGTEYKGSLSWFFNDEMRSFYTN